MTLLWVSVGTKFTRRLNAPRAAVTAIECDGAWVKNSTVDWSRSQTPAHVVFELRRYLGMAGAAVKQQVPIYLPKPVRIWE
jgi:hypothetical protein